MPDGIAPPPAPSAASSPLPPIGFPPGTVLPGAPPASPPPASPAPVGRPSADPEKQEQRVTKRAEVNRLMNILPKTATDSKIYVYRIRGRNRRDHARCATILISDIEDSGQEADDYIRSIIEDECGEGKYECVAMSNKNRRIPDFQPWQIAVGEDYEEFDDEEVEMIRPPSFGNTGDARYDPRLPPHLQHLNPAMRNDPRYSQAPPAPPTIEPPPNVLETMKAINETDREEKRDTMTLMISMMQQNMQVLLATMQQQQNSSAAFAADREAREEKWRQEEAAREQREHDRAAQRASERTQLYATLAPLLIPILTKMMEGKEDKLTPILLERLAENKNNNMGLETAMQVMMEANKQTVLAQGEANRQNMQLQGETSKALVTHVLGMAQEAMRAQRQLESGESEDASPIERFLSTMERFAPMLGGLVGQPRGAAATDTPVPVQQQRIAPPDPMAQPTPVRPSTGAAKQQPPPPPPVDVDAEGVEYTDEQLIGGCLDTIRQMQIGKIPQQQYGQALLWCAENVPESMEDAIRAQDQAKVIELATPTVKAHSALLHWIKQPTTNEFLSWAIENIRLILIRMDEQEAANPDEDGTVIDEKRDDFDDLAGKEGTSPDDGGDGDEQEDGGKKLPPPPPAEELPPAGTVEDSSGIGEVERTDYPETDISKDIPSQPEGDGSTAEG